MLLPAGIVSIGTLWPPDFLNNVQPDTSTSLLPRLRNSIHSSAFERDEPIQKSSLMTTGAGVVAALTRAASPSTANQNNQRIIRVKNIGDPILEPPRLVWSLYSSD